MNDYITSCFVWTVCYKYGELLSNHGIDSESASKISEKVFSEISSIDIPKTAMKFNKKVTMPKTRTKKIAKNTVQNAYELQKNKYNQPEWVLFDKELGTYYCSNISLEGDRIPIADFNYVVFVTQNSSGEAYNLTEMDKVVLKNKGVECY